MPDDLSAKSPRGPDRRDLLWTGVAAMAAMAGGVSKVWAAVADPGVAPRSFPPQAMIFLEAFCDTVIPDTDTPGARSVKAPRFIQLLLERSLEPREMKDLIVQTEGIQTDLDTRCGGRFASLGERERTLALEALDHEVMASGTATPAKPYATAYRRLKALTVFGYYTSEVGGSHELRYELAPGRLDADIPVDPNLRPFSNG